jgi:hypothetical protein
MCGPDGGTVCARARSTEERPHRWPEYTNKTLGSLIAAPSNRKRTPAHPGKCTPAHPIERMPRERTPARSRVRSLRSARPRRSMATPGAVYTLTSRLLNLRWDNACSSTYLLLHRMPTPESSRTSSSTVTWRPCPCRICKGLVKQHPKTIKRHLDRETAEGLDQSARP